MGLMEYTPVNFLGTEDEGKYSPANFILETPGVW